MSAISDLRSTIRSEISSLVAMSCLRLAMSSERSGVVAVRGSTSVSILLKVGVSVSLVEGWPCVGRDTMTFLSSATVEVMKLRSSESSFLMASISAA